MQHDRTKFFERDYYGSTFVHPIGLASIIALGVLTIVLPRKYAIIPLMVLINFVPCSQRIAIAGLDFNFLRIMVMFGWARIAMKGEFKSFRLTLLDKLLLGWAISETAIYVLQFRTFGSLITMCGRMMEAVGGYFMVRLFVRDWEDVIALAKGLAFISIPVGIFFVIEKFTGRNYFSVFGGVPEYTTMREGKLRAMGAIANPILAGCLWAAFLPMMGALWWSKGGKALAATGVTSALFIVVACASSTPLAATMAAGFTAFLFPFRYRLQEIRIRALQVLMVLHILKLTRGKPVWHLLASIDLVGGSTGWHRYNLIQQWINFFPQWALLGTRSTAHWGWGLWDITNQFVLESVRGGLLTLIFFCWMIYVAFKNIGPLWREVEKNPAYVAMAWAVGASLFVHCCSFIAVSYFGQMIIGFYMQLALIGSLYSAWELARETEDEEDEDAALEVTEAPKQFQRERRLLGAI